MSQQMSPLSVEVLTRSNFEWNDSVSQNVMLLLDTAH